MYSRATPFQKADKIAGTHQKIDRAARLTLRKILSKNPTFSKVHFPKIDEILVFEGNGGPDGIKTKSPGKDEPWHFVEPYGDLTPIKTYVENHLFNLSKALSEENYVRASFEAGWMAHAITDALTPAHQYPMTDKIIEISGKKPEERDKIIKKMFLSGKNWRERLLNNWEYIGPKGVMSSHMLYEMGVATMITSIAAKKITNDPTEEEISRVLNGNFMEVFEEKIKWVADQKYYETYLEKGWTTSLARNTKSILLPEISKIVALGWFEGIRRASVKDFENSRSKK
jgi:hypothetical protein